MTKVRVSLARLIPVLLTSVAAIALAGPAAAGPAPDPEPSTPKNGPGGITTRIVDGTPTGSTNYPFLVFVGGCTGSLIKSDWVVTARHCPNPPEVRVGSNDRTSGGTVATVSRIENHPTLDVKLLKLSSAVAHAPAPIPDTSGAVGTATRIIGWGLTCPTQGCAAPPTVAHQLDTSILADSECSGINGPYEICTDNPGDDAGACYGDSGGPQVRKIDGTWHLIGATSRAGDGGSTCAVAPSIYTDLPAIRSWISEKVGGGLPS